MVGVEKKSKITNVLNCGMQVRADLYWFGAKNVMKMKNSQNILKESSPRKLDSFSLSVSLCVGMAQFQYPFIILIRSFNSAIMFLHSKALWNF